MTFFEALAGVFFAAFLAMAVPRPLVAAAALLAALEAAFLPFGAALEAFLAVLAAFLRSQIGEQSIIRSPERSSSSTRLRTLFGRMVKSLKLVAQNIRIPLDSGESFVIKIF